MLFSSVVSDHFPPWPRVKILALNRNYKWIFYLGKFKGLTKHTLSAVSMQKYVLDQHWKINQSRCLMFFQLKSSVLLCQKFLLNSHAKKQLMDNKGRDRKKTGRWNQSIAQLKGTHRGYISKQRKQQEKEKVCLFAGVGGGGWEGFISHRGPSLAEGRRQRLGGALGAQRHA